MLERTLENKTGAFSLAQFSSEYKITHPVVQIDDALSHHLVGKFIHSLIRYGGVFINRDFPFNNKI